MSKRNAPLTTRKVKIGDLIVREFPYEFGMHKLFLDEFPGFHVLCASDHQGSGVSKSPITHTVVQPLWFADCLKKKEISGISLSKYLK